MERQSVVREVAAPGDDRRATRSVCRQAESDTVNRQKSGKWRGVSDVVGM